MRICHTTHCSSVYPAVTLGSSIFNKEFVRPDAKCDAFPAVSRAQALRDDDSDPLNLNRECFCQQLGASIYTEGASGQICSSFLEAYLTRRGLIVFSAVMVVVVNFVLRISMRYISVYEKHKTVSNQQSAVLNKLFVSYFINTAVITLVLNANFGGNFDWLNIGIVFNGEYTDLTEGWFNFVGVGLVLAMILNMFNPGVISWVWIFVMRVKRSRLADKCETQTELNKLYSGFRFELASRYAAILNTFFVTLMYAPGLPILLPIAFMAMLLNYWFDKTAFLRLYATPPRYDSTVEKDFIDMLPRAIILHSAFAIWFYTSPVTHWGLERAAMREGGESLQLGERMTAAPALPHFVIIVVLCGAWLLKTFLSNTFGKLLALCCGAHEANVYKDFPDYWNAKKLTVLESYHLSQQAKHQLAFIRTTSGLQLPPTCEILDNPLKAEAKSAGNAFMRRKHNETIVNIGQTAGTPSGGVGFTGHAPAPDQDGHHVVAVMCGACQQPFSIVDMGHAMTYNCPHCHQEVVV